MANNSGDRFPDTPDAVLRKAAAGQWHDFVELYLRPCQREMALACRGRGIPAADADDLFQTLLLRLLRLGRSRAPGGSDDDSPVIGNLPARFLQGSRSRTDVARFRTFLKAAILNIVREELRRRTRRKRQLPLDDQLAIIEPLVDQTVEQSLHLRSLADSLRKAAETLAAESAKHTTQGRRRYFDVLKRTIVGRQSIGFIAREYGVDRTNVSRLSTAARLRFMEILQRITGIEDAAELKRTLASKPEILRGAFLAAAAAPKNNG